MKKVLLVILFSFMSLTAYADTQLTEPELGVGADVVLWWNDTQSAMFIEEVTAQYRHDYYNGGGDTVYAVVRVNPWRLLQKYERINTDVTGK